jgi:predicted  nucleic acid-binding Zn-ribbon protein
MDAWLCPDCTEREHKYNPALTDDYDPETGDGFIEFSKTPCYVCGNKLHGSRYRFRQWGDEMPRPLTLPCVECGEPVDADIHAEELGFCLDCSNAYFDHSDEEETEKENN